MHVHLHEMGYALAESVWALFGLFMLGASLVFAVIYKTFVP